MIAGIGSDILEIPRIRRLLGKWQQRAIDRVLHADEQLEMQQRKDPVAYFASRFAAKEAVSKALGTGFRQGVAMKDVVIVRSEHGAPKVELFGVAKQLAARRSIDHVLITISDEKNYVVAFAVAMTE